MTEREKKLRLRRKHAEEIIAWKKKLDAEELQVREIEKKANLVLSSKTKAITPTNPTISNESTNKKNPQIITKIIDDNQSS